MITVESKVETEKILESFVLLATLAQHCGEVVGPILVRVNLSWECSATAVGVLVDLGCDRGELCEQAHSVVESGLPVVSLVETLLVLLRKRRLVVQSANGA
jgi:hypothetical protein